ncbi:hypothetical protein [Desulfonema magnum]|nr:hypothetical protein [Desulfonema magnum]
MLRVFGSVGVESHFQELKNVLRWQLQGDDKCWSLPQKPGGIIYLKETLGPYWEEEACFNPLNVLLEAGLPPEKLQVLIIGRAPLRTWASWYSWWPTLRTLEKFILAYKTTEMIRQQAARQGIPTTILVYETLRDHGAETVIKKLFNRLEVPFSHFAVQGWRELPPFGSPNSNIVFPKEPPIFCGMSHMHEVPRKSRKLVYFSREKNIPGLRKEDVKTILAEGLPEIYEKWRAACENDLNIEIGKDRDWDHYGPHGHLKSGHSKSESQTNSDFAHHAN